MSEPVKRFIAGAVCPKCGAMDTVRSFTIEERMVRECVMCDFSDEMSASGEAQELPTRVNQADKLVLEQGEQVVKII
jgi:uncharacterized metal-binding protein (TIGR02443 family)